MMVSLRAFDYASNTIMQCVIAYFCFFCNLALGIQCSNPMLVMKHAAKLAAVGAQTQDGTSPLMAASAATAEAYFSDGSSADGSNRLRPDCGNCAACRGMVAPCGRCHNCR